MDDETETDPRETEAAKHNLQYIALDGNIACMGKIFFLHVFILYLYLYGNSGSKL